MSDGSACAATSRASNALGQLIGDALKREPICFGLLVVGNSGKPLMLGKERLILRRLVCCWLAMPVRHHIVFLVLSLATQ